MTTRHSYGWIPYLAPSLILILAIAIWPLGYAAWLATHDFSPLLPFDPPFVGLGMFDLAFSEPRFWNGLRVTVILLVGGLLLQGSLALGLALLLARQDIVGRRLMMVIAFLPAFINPIATGYIFRLLFSPQGGPINAFLSIITRQDVSIDWIGEPTPAIIAVLVADTWQWTPFLTVIFLAGIINLRREPYEAARLDRASAWQVLRAITMPAIAALVVVMLVIRGIEIVKIFDTIFALTAGGPGTSTETLSFYAYQVGFKSFELSYAAAISWFLLVVVVIASLILFKTGARNLFRI
jgi:multiple sugar transport system permease protein